MTGNAMIGGVSAGVVRALKGGSFWRGMRDGALGGAVAYAGRRIAAEHFSGAGLLGREVGAVGSSIVRNAAAGRGPLEELVLPLAVAYVHLRTGRPARSVPRARLKLDLPTIVASAYYALRSDARLDASASLSSGALVFETSERGIDGWTGYQGAGAIWLRGDAADRAPDAPLDAALAHERVHVLQYDFGLLAWSDPIEQWLSRRHRAGPWLHRHVHVGVHLAAWGLANAIVPYDQRPWEHEAYFLSRVRSEGR